MAFFDEGEDVAGGFIDRGAAAVKASFGPILASWGPFLAIFSNNVTADWRHPDVGGPNLVGRSALARGTFRPSLEP